MVREERSYTIRQLGDAFGVTARTLRFYEDKGLIAPQRVGNSRIYGARDRARLSLIVQGRSVGFSLDELREMLDLYDEKDGGALQMAATLVKFRERIETLRHQRDALDAAVSSLEAGCARLEARLSALQPETLPRASDYDSVLRARLDGFENALRSAQD